VIRAYTEDETPGRLAQIEQVNAALAEILEATDA
jgi:hypothetical protein